MSIISNSLPSTLPAFPLAYSRHCSLSRKRGPPGAPDFNSGTIAGSAPPLSDVVCPSKFCTTLPASRVRALNCFSRTCMFFFENSRNFSWALDVARLPLAIRPGSKIGHVISLTARRSWIFRSVSSEICRGFVFRIKSFFDRALGIDDLSFFSKKERSRLLLPSSLFSSRIKWEQAPSMVMDATQAFLTDCGSFLFQ